MSLGAEQEAWEMLGGWEEMGSLASRWALHPHEDEVPRGQQPPLHLSLCFLNGLGFFFFSPW